MPKEEKSKYTEAYETEKANYKKAYDDYVAKWGKPMKMKKDLSSDSGPEEEVDPNIPAPPKRPLGIFFRYVADVIEDYKKKFPGAKRTLLVGKIAEAWKTISKEDKSKY